MLKAEENLNPPLSSKKMQSHANSLAPQMFKIVKMYKLRWEVVLVEAPEDHHSPVGLERCLSVNAIKKPLQQLKSPQTWSALLPASHTAFSGKKAMKCECTKVAGDTPAGGHCHPDDMEHTIYGLSSKNPLCEMRTAPTLSKEQCLKHDNLLRTSHKSTSSKTDLVCKDTVLLRETSSRQHCQPVGKEMPNDDRKAKKPLHGLETQLQQQCLKRDTLRMAPPFSNKIKLWSKDTLVSVKSKKAFSELKTAQASSSKCPKCPFCYQHHE